jgi:hypothetical protein
LSPDSGSDSRRAGGHPREQFRQSRYRGGGRLAAYHHESLALAEVAES